MDHVLDIIIYYLNEFLKLTYNILQNQEILKENSYLTSFEIIIIHTHSIA
jgi:hypothetical protein